ncbi:MAG: glycine-rich domain-containing protein [Roseibacillus sp.]
MKEEVVSRILEFEVGEPNANLSFLARLCREQRWTRAYAGRVFLEYKRFIILGLYSGHPVTPSEHVDHIWHLHLLYTRSYWHDFCRDTLGQDFHHGPTQGGAAEGAKFTDWYERTLDSYQNEFDEPPPPDIWPSPTRRFRHGGDWKCYNSSSHFLIPKPAQLIQILLGR